MSNFHGAFVWYELMTTDATAAEAFYRSVVGWNTQAAGQPGKPYTLLLAGQAPVAGLMVLPAEARAAGARPGWIGYVAVEDVDAYAGKVSAAGGRVHRPAEDIPEVGRFCVVADPQGAVFVLFRAQGGMTPPPPPPPGAPGHVGWRELLAADWPSAFAFYAGLFGWTKGEVHDMGPMGVYQLFEAGGETVGGMMTKPPEVPAPFWTYYLQVDAIGAAVSRLQAAGGTVLHGPAQVPGGAWIVQAVDPQGALFALVSQVA